MTMHKHPPSSACLLSSMLMHHDSIFFLLLGTLLVFLFASSSPAAVRSKELSPQLEEARSPNAGSQPTTATPGSCPQPHSNLKQHQKK